MSKKISRSLGRRVPRDWGHVEKYPYGVKSLTRKKIIRVNKSLVVPYAYDQGSTSGCVGYSSQTMMGIYNRKRYDCNWLYCEACKVDNDDRTSCEKDMGTYTVASFRVLKSQGDKILGQKKAILKEGIKSYEWATNVEGVRLAISSNKPVLFGINWYADFDEPELYDGNWWIGRASDWGRLGGGHAICCYGASDNLQAVRLVNTWGTSYPRVYISYESITRLLNEDGEAGIVVDR